MDRYDRYTYLAMDASARWPRDGAAEHEEILDAVQARDDDLAVKLSQEHIRRTADLVAAAWTDTPAHVAKELPTTADNASDSSA